MDMPESPAALSRGLKFARAHAGLLLAVSVLLLFPCFWHRHIEAGDLPSHTYNAWLAHLVEQGRAPGLYTVWRYDNILFDLLLLYSSKLLGFSVGSKIAVSICVLLFFWGVFSLVTVASGRPPWFLAPVIAMLTFGFTFNMGFFNYYLSIGLACFGLAILWRPAAWDWFAGAIVLALAILAHPIGALWLVATLAYVFLRRKFQSAWGLLIPIAVIAIFATLHYYLANVSGFEVNWLDRPFYWFNGADQLVLYTYNYRWISVSIAAIFIILLVQYFSRLVDATFWKPVFFLIELYLLAFCVTSLLPRDLRFDANAAWIGLLTPRLTVISAIFALCVLSYIAPRLWAFATFTACAAVFFAFLYKDTGKINRLESNLEKITANLPYGTRIIPVLDPPPDSRIIFINHVVDRACIEHCFVYSNYEASSAQFHLRVHSGSPVVTDRQADSGAMENGDYVVRGSDAPLKSIYQCLPQDFTVVCIRDLGVGQTTRKSEDELP